MKLSFAGFTTLCLVALAFTGSVKAQNSAAQYAKLNDEQKALVKAAINAQCIVKFIGFIARDDGWVRARDLKESCACETNKTIQGLMVEGCPKIGNVTNEKVRKYFGP